MSRPHAAAAACRQRKGEDVDLIDVLDFIADCVMAGMARSGSVYPLALPAELLERAFQNTVALLRAQIVLAPQEP